MKIYRSAAALTALLAAAPAFAAGGSVKGKVTFSGATIPASTDLTDQLTKSKDKDVCLAGPKASEELIVDAASKTVANVFVSIKVKDGGKKLEVPASPILSDQKSCHFEPHIIVVPEGAKVELKNSDTVMHNVNPKQLKNPDFVNEGIPAGKSVVKTTKKAERIKIACDVHPWMAGYIIVTDTPYWALTGKDGSFEIGDLPAGEYTVNFWHETLGTLKQEKIVVKDGAATECNGAMAPKAGG